MKLTVSAVRRTTCQSYCRFVCAAVLSFSGILAAQDTVPEQADCPFFGPQRERFYTDVYRKHSGMVDPHRLSTTTAAFAEAMGFVPGGSRTYNYDASHKSGSIDAYIFADFQAKGITPAPKSSDWEFIRRVTLDLTGRIPAPDSVLRFVDDTAKDKRAKLVEELIARPEFIDKWTMYFGDLLRNTVQKTSTGTLLQTGGRNAFYAWIKDAVTKNKPYDQMTREVIAATTEDTFKDGPSNFLVGAFVTMGPSQDVMDQMAANTMETFLGMTHVNCVLCHNGRGHLENINLWGVQSTRYQAWQLSSFFSHTQAGRVQYDPANHNNYSWSLLNNSRGYTQDYALNTTVGNRPARQPGAGCKTGQDCNYVPPQYVFTGASPKTGEDYRTSLATAITGDFQFARATVNYMWAYFFGRGIVDPPDTFDPMRQDPDNPPPDPWTLQPSNARLLNGMAQHFIETGYDMRQLMREIVNSDTYQLSATYPGKWNPEWESYFARKFVRRLWGEEILDAIAQATGVFPSMAVTGMNTEGTPFRVSYTMQFPDIRNTSDAATDAFLDSFLRGNRDDLPRKPEGSILQTLNLLNSPLVENKLGMSGAAASPLLVEAARLGNTDAVNKLYLAILSRYPTKDEMTTALNALPNEGSTRNAAIQDLAWSLFNKVDFIFNY
jgi:hypothetical protein